MNEVWAWVVQAMIVAWAQTEVKFMLAHIVINWIAALAAAIMSGEFRFRKVVEFLYRKLLPLTMLYTVLKFLGQHVGLAALAPVVFGLIEVKLFAELGENLVKLGVRLPQGIKRWIVHEPSLE